MDQKAVLAAFNEQMRRPAAAATEQRQVEHDNGVVRVVSATDGWSGVLWSDLDATSADDAIAAQLRRFAGAAQPWEWKYYSYDQPPDLPDRLLAAGFTAEPTEALMIAEIADLKLDTTPPAGIDLRPVADQRGADALVAVHEEVFGGDYSALGKAVMAGLAQRPPTAAAVVAMAGDTAVSAARVEFDVGTDFAGLWGGGTLAAWRGRGIFRSLVSYRAALAYERGFRYLQVDASDDSRPILERLGFTQLATTTPYVMNPRG